MSVVAVIYCLRGNRCPKCNALVPFGITYVPQDIMGGEIWEIEEFGNGNLKFGPQPIIINIISIIMIKYLKRIANNEDMGDTPTIVLQ